MRQQTIVHRDAWKTRLMKHAFTHYVTLTTNRADLSVAYVRRRLREWDARINRKFVGPRWKERPDERMLWFAFLEEAEVSPHWHLLLEVDPEHADRWSDLEVHARRIWEELVPSGTVNVQPYRDAGVIDYVLKNLDETKPDHQVIYREFHG